jgi:hypothetical protein
METKGPRIGLILGLAGAGGCLGLIALAVVGAVLFFHNAMEKCPPKDFPVYPSAQKSEFDYTFTGGTSRCFVAWESDDAPDEVVAFYDNGLQTGAWHLLRTDPETGIRYLQRRDDSSVSGRMAVFEDGGQTRIEAEILTGQASPATDSP